VNCFQGGTKEPFSVFAKKAREATLPKTTVNYADDYFRVAIVRTTILLTLFVALPLCCSAAPASYRYALQLVDMPVEDLRHCPIVWQNDDSDKLGQGMLERSTSNQARVNFFITGGSIRVFASPRKVADALGNCEIDLMQNGFGVKATFSQAEGLTRAHVDCSWPRGAARSLSCEWPNPERQFLCLRNLYRSEDRSSLASLSMFSTHFIDYPDNRTTFLMFTADRPD